MRRTVFGWMALTISIAALSAPARAEVGFRGLGPRVGLASDPDQVIAGMQFDLGEFAKRVRWQPSFEVGFGDDTVAVVGNFMVSYYFPVDAKVTPYAGGEITLGWFDRDRNDNDPDHEDEVEIGPAAVGGIEMRLSGGTRFLAELEVGIADVHDVRAVVGWTF